MFRNKLYFVYILTNNKNTVLYTGVTNNLYRQIKLHKDMKLEGFTKKYNLTKLVYFETHNDISEAIKREKKLKRWKRQWKVELINSFNNEWNDLYPTLKI